MTFGGEARLGSPAYVEIVPEICTEQSRTKTKAVLGMQVSHDLTTGNSQTWFDIETY